MLLRKYLPSNSICPTEGHSLFSLSTLVLVALLSVSVFSASAQPASKASSKSKAPAKSQPAGKHLILAVSEGTSGSIDPLEAVAKYRPLADVLGTAIGQQVIVTLVRSFDALEEGMKKDAFDLVMARPSDYPGRGVRDYGYSLIATSKPDGQCYFLVEKSSPLKKLSEAKGKQIMFPEKIAYMTRFCSAEMRDHGIDVKKEQVRYAKEQGAVGWTVQNKLSDVGGVASYAAVAKGWEKSGQRVLHKSVTQPYFPLIASKRVAPEKIAKMQKALANIGATDEGKKVLATIGIQGYNIESQERLLNLLKWLEKA